MAQFYSIHDVVDRDCTNTNQKLRYMISRLTVHGFHHKLRKRKLSTSNMTMYAHEMWCLQNTPQNKQEKVINRPQETVMKFTIFFAHLWALLNTHTHTQSKHIYILSNTYFCKNVCEVQFCINKVRFTRSLLSKRLIKNVVGLLKRNILFRVTFTYDVVWRIKCNSSPEKKLKENPREKFTHAKRPCNNLKYGYII